MAWAGNSISAQRLADLQGLLRRHIFTGEFGQKAAPVLVGQRRVLGQFPLDHQDLDVVYRVHVLHAVLDHLPHGLQALDGAHGRDRVALHEDVALREQF